MSLFGHYDSSPTPYAFNGQPGWHSVPGGYSWYIYTDKGFQKWVSPNPITVDADGVVTSRPVYAAELNLDGTLVFQEQLASRKLNIDSPAHDRLSPNN